MKVKVLTRFRDKHSGEYYKKDQILVITKERYEEILKVAPLVEEVKETKKAKNAAE